MVTLRVVTSTNGRQLPSSCPQCGESAGLRAVMVGGVEAGVRY